MRMQRFIEAYSTVRVTCFLIVFATAIFVVAAHAEFPDRPVNLNVGYEPGGTVGVIARTLAIATVPFLRQNIIVDYKPGGSGSVVLSTLANSKPDGYLLAAVTTDALVGFPLMQKVQYKPLKSFTPIMGHSSSEHTALIVKYDAPWKTFKEFLDYAKKNPGKVKYSTTGVGSPMHVAMEFIARKDGIKWVHVPYKGQAAARTAVMGGHVDACSSGVDWPPFAQSGSIRPIATYGHKRSPHSPNIPTIKELGYDFVSDPIHLILAPAGLPPKVLETLESAFIKGANSPEVRTVQETVCATPVLYTSKEYERYLKKQWTTMEAIFKETSIIKETATQPY